jgi:type VI secretion system secreted protein Hcp
MHALSRTTVLALALTLASPAAAKQPSGTAAFSDPKIGTLAFTSYTFGVTNTGDTGSGGGGGAGKAVFSPFTLVRAVDAVSPLLVEAAATGKHIANVTIVVANGGVPVTYALQDVIVSGVQHSGAAGEATETLSLAYASVAISSGG